MCRFVIVTIVLVIDALAFNPAVGKAIESGPARENSIALSKVLATIPFEVIDNRIFLPVRLNGTGPYYFILDSGGSTWLPVR
jgi:hypothetical protein